MGKVFLGLIVLVFSNVSVADYVKLYAGAISLDGAAKTFDDEIDNASDPGSPLALSYGFFSKTNWVVEAELARYANDLEVGNTVVGDVEVMTLGFNSVYNIEVFNNLKIYGGGGLAFALYETGGNDKTGTGVTFQILSGVSYDILDKFSVGFEARYINSLIGDLADTDYDYSNIAAGVFALYKL